MKAIRKTTNLYRRVSAVSYKSAPKATPKSRKNNGVKCLVCLVTLVKSSKDRDRAGVKLRCPCNARICSTCFANNPQWHLTEPHLSQCVVLQSFICSQCSTFQGIKEKVCCVWMCPQCSRGHQQGPCSQCSQGYDPRERRDTRTLWCQSKRTKGCEEVNDAVYNEDNIACYRHKLKNDVLEKVSKSRHLSAQDIRTLFHECFTPQPCVCGKDQNPMCVGCAPVLTIMELLSKNPQPLMASMAERAIPGRALARHVYNRALLIDMLNDPKIPMCVNGKTCKGMLVRHYTPKPLRSLMAPQTYRSLVSSNFTPDQDDVHHLEAHSCIVCLLFNQSAAITQMLSSQGMYLEPHPSGPVYYFNIKLSPDVGIPEVAVDNYQGYLINFQGSVGSYRPSFYYNWRDMLDVLQVDHTGKITISPLQ